jgi:hypothetical protein
MAAFANLDLSVLDELAELKAQREVMQQRLAAMEERRAEVAPPVYLRVRGDYEAQKQALLEKEQPVQAKAKALYGELHDALDKLERESESAKLSQQELEFRHSLGEFAAGEFDKRKQAIVSTLSARQAEHEQARSIRERFLQAFGSEAALFDAPTKVEAPQAEPAKPRFGNMPDVGELTAIVKPVPPPIPPASGSPATAIPAPPTLGSVTEQVQPVPAPPMPSPPAIPAEPVKRANPDATVVFRPGRLLPQNKDAGDSALMLSLRPIVIGSDAGCDVILVNVAGRQAEISLTRAGFIFRDVGGAGVGMLTVNDVPVAEQLLRDGDLLQVGTARFSFKSA